MIFELIFNPNFTTKAAILSDAGEDGLGYEVEEELDELGIIKDDEDIGKVEEETNEEEEEIEEYCGLELEDEGFGDGGGSIVLRKILLMPPPMLLTSSDNSLLIVRFPSLLSPSSHFSPPPPPPPPPTKIRPAVGETHIP
ncbi:hypothetical protein PV325_002190, partial [Microctonus aethiopoides]